MIFKEDVSTDATSYQQLDTITVDHRKATGNGEQICIGKSYMIIA